MAASHFVNVSDKRVMSTIEQNTILKKTKDTTEFGPRFFKLKKKKFLVTEITLFNSSGNWLLISVRVIKSTVTDWSHRKKRKQFTTELEST